MRADGDILLVACYELGHQPLAVAWPAAFLQRAGFRPSVLDVSIQPLDAEAVRRARLVAVSVPMHTALRLGVVVARRVRELNPAAHVCFYGHYAALNADYLRRSGGADSLRAGEVEADLVDLAERLDRGATVDPHRTTVGRLDFPRPRRDGLPGLERYAHLDDDGARVPVAYVEASRGCKHRCRHCPIPPVYGGRFVVVPVDVVMDDVRQQYAAGARHVSFGDPDFLNGPRHALAVARALHAELPELTFDFTAKIEHLLRQREWLPELRALGCRFIVSAAESLDDHVLAVLDKGHTAADVRRALAVVREAGIALRPTWVAFTPWTTLDGYRAWLDFLDEEDLVDAVDPVQYGLRLLVPPGSLLLEHPAMQPHLGRLVEAAFCHEWTHPDPRLDRLQAAVAAEAARAADRREPPTAMFPRVQRLAADAAGVSPPAVRTRSTAARRTPRLTESWFC